MVQREDRQPRCSQQSYLALREERNSRQPGGIFSTIEGNTICDIAQRGWIGGLSAFGEKAVNTHAADNVYLAGAKPSVHDKDALVAADFKPGLKLQEKPDGWWLEMAVNPDWTSKQKRAVVTTELLGKAKIPNAPFEKPDGTPYLLDKDYFGKKRNTVNPAPGPFEFSGEKVISLKVWPRK